MTKKKDLYADHNLTKTFIAICTPKRWCYVYVIIVYVLTENAKNVCTIHLYISLLFSFNNLLRYNLFSFSKDSWQYHKSHATFLLRLRWFNSHKNFMHCHKTLKQFPFIIVIKMRKWVNLLTFGVLTFRHLWWYSFLKIGWEAIKCFRKLFVNNLFRS